MTNEKKATAILDNMAHDPMFMTAGRRNNDMVNLCIVCGILRLNAIEELQKMNKVISAELQEHYDRIDPYVDSWLDDPWWYTIDADYLCV